MKQIRKDELYENLSEFLRGKGVELKEGPYTKGVHAGCSMLADAINLSQAGLERARTEIGRKVDQVRQVIHEKTAPKPPPVVSTAAKARDGTNAPRESSAASRPPRPGARKGRTPPGKKRPHRGHH